MNKNINTLFQDAYSIVSDLGIEIGTIKSVTWNKRFTSCWGICRRHRIGTTYVYRIELSAELNDDLVSWESAMDTMIHEILHCHKDRFCHTGEWKRCAELINKEYKGLYNIKRCTAATEKGLAADRIGKEPYKYIVKCCKCGAEWKYKRECTTVKRMRIADTSYYKCSCGGHEFKVIDL